MLSWYQAGAAYDRISEPLERIGLKVLDRLELTGAETVLDAGCGSDRVTQALIERVPRGHVIALDGSPAMIAAARVRLGDSAELLLQDLEELDLGGRRVDAVLSTSTFHWIADHAQLFGRLRDALRDGGRLVAQCDLELLGQQHHTERAQRAAGEALCSLAQSLAEPATKAQPELGEEKRLQCDEDDHEACG